MPTGTKEYEEDPLLAAKRELEEETGITAEKWTALGEFTAAGSVVNLKKFLFLAQNLTLGQQALAADEAIETMWLPYEEVMALIDSGEIHDAASVLALMKSKT